MGHSSPVAWTQVVWNVSYIQREGEKAWRRRSTSNQTILQSLLSLLHMEKDLCSPILIHQGPPRECIEKASEITDKINKNRSFLPQSQPFSRTDSFPMLNQKQENCNFVWHCVIHWLFPQAIGGQFYARNGGGFLSPLSLQTTSENACLDMQQIFLSPAKVWKTKSLGCRHGSNLTIFLAVVLINQSWFGFFSMSQATWAFWAKCRGLLVSMSPNRMAKMENALESRNQHSTAVVSYAAGGGWGL